MFGETYGSLAAGRALALHLLLGACEPLRRRGRGELEAVRAGAPEAQDHFKD